MEKGMDLARAQRWTAELVVEHLDAIEQDVLAGGSLFLGRALARRGLYKQVWSYWRKVFVMHDDILIRMMRIETLLESNIIEGALRKDLSSYVAMLTLRYNYQWNDKAEAEPETAALPPEVSEGEPFEPALHVRLDEDTIFLVYKSGGGATYRKVCDGPEKDWDRK